MTTRLRNDRQVADILGMSQPWVRQQRFLRRHGKPHVFDVDPVLIGRSPRYCLDDVEAWIERRRMQADLRAPDDVV